MESKDVAAGEKERVGEDRITRAFGAKKAKEGGC